MSSTASLKHFQMSSAGRPPSSHSQRCLAPMSAVHSLRPQLHNSPALSTRCYTCHPLALKQHKSAGHSSCLSNRTRHQPHPRHSLFASRLPDKLSQAAGHLPCCHSHLSHKLQAPLNGLHKAAGPTLMQALQKHAIARAAGQCPRTRFCHSLEAL